MDSRVRYVQLLGLPELLGRIGEVRISVHRRIMKQAMASSIKPTKPTVASVAPMQYKALKQSMGVKVKTYRPKDGGHAIAVGLVGPRTAFKKTVQKYNFFTDKAQPMVAYPAAYAHMVEGGTKAHRVGMPGHGKYTRKKARREGRTLGALRSYQHPGSAPRPFMAGATRIESPKILERFRRFLVRNIKKEWGRTQRKGTHFFKSDNKRAPRKK